MIRNLQKVKERCARSKDPEAEILQMTSRSRRYAEKNILPDANGIRSLKPEDSVAAMSESLSSIPDEKLYYSDNQKLSVIRDAEIQKRIRNEELMKDKHERRVAPTGSLKVSPKLKKAEKLQKTNTISNDGAKYMSYVKISKKQHELVKSMKQSGSSIQSRSLNRVLGNLNSFNVKPYEMFVEEEQNRIHDYWSNMANNDLPAALQNWRDRQSERKQIMNSLLHELEEKLRLTTKDEKLDNYDSHSEAQDEKLDHYNFHVQSQDENLVNPINDEDSEDTDADSSQGPSGHQQDDDSAATQGSTSSDERDSNPSSTQSDSPMHNPPLNVNQDFDPSTVENQSSVENAPPSVEEEVHLSPAENQSSVHNPTLNVNEEFHPMDLNAENNVTMELDTRETCSRTMPPDLQVMPPDLQVMPQTSEASLNISHPESHSSGITAGIPCSSVKNVWASIGLPESYRHAPPTTQYASSSEPSFRHPQFLPNQSASLIDLESDLRGEDTTKDLLNRHSTDHIPFFNPYPNRDRSELLHSLIKRETYHPEQKKTGLEFHPTSSVLLEPTQFHSHFRNQMPPSFALDNRPKAQGGPLFMNPNIQESIYSDTRYPIQGQEHFQTLNVRDWANTRLPAPPIQAPQLSSGEPLSHNWFATDNRAHGGGWSAAESTIFSSPSLGSGSSGDQSLYSVLTQCNTLRARAPSFNPVIPAEQIISPTNYGQDMAGEIPMSSNNSALPVTVSPFDYLSGNEVNAATSLKNTNMGWMSLGQQSSGLQDPSGRPFFKSWNQ